MLPQGGSMQNRRRSPPNWCSVIRGWKFSPRFRARASAKPRMHSKALWKGSLRSSKSCMARLIFTSSSVRLSRPRPIRWASSLAKET